MKRILRAEGVLAQVGLDAPVDLSSWQTAFRSLRALGENIIVEGEDPEVDEFVIGRIRRVNQKSVTMQHFDGTGLWEEGVRTCPYERTTSVKFRCEYTTVFSRHLRNRKTR
jgi:hypothetical protein